MKSDLLLDSSFLLELLLQQPLSEKCARALAGRRGRISVISQFECYRKLRSKISEGDAMEAMAALEEFPTVPLSTEIAIYAADLAIDLQLGMADSIVLATAREIGATLITLDNDFSRVPDVRIIR